MKIPKTLKINAITYKVIVDNTATDSGCLGRTLLTKEKMHLDKEMSQQRKEQTLLHEILHIVFFEAGLDTRYKDGQQQEEVVTTLANGLYQVLKENNLLK